MTMKIRVAFFALLLTALPALSAAQSLSGTITGTVTDAQGAVLPGVTVVATGRQGSQTQVTDDSGVFRFLGLTPGRYSVRADLAGFRPYEEKDLDLAIGRTITLKVSMALGGLEESVDVIASPVSVDTTTTATDTTISQELLFSMPISRTNAATSMLNYTPGVNSGSAFGGPAGSGNALMLDGVDTSDPEGGTAWVFFNYNLMDEVQVGALGQPAEYGGFTGAVVNTITKSGGNRYSSLFEYRYTEKGLRGDNLDADVKRQNPSLQVSGVDKLNDYTVQLGGPIRRDKAFFFASIQRYSIREDPAGPRTIRTEVSPRFNFKLTLQPTSSDNISGTFQYDQYNQTGRTSLAGTAGTTDALSVEQDSPEFVWNGTYRKVLGSTSFFEAKFTGYRGYFDLDPKTNESFHYQDDGGFSGGGGYNAKYDRFRNQLNAAYSRYVDAGGTHNFKFGVEIERSTTRNRSSYVNDVYFYDIDGVPAYAYSYSYDLEGDTNRNTFYAQDQWSIGRLTANVGVRVDGHRGIGSQNNVKYYSTTAVAPRLGVAIDLTGRATSVVRAFYGQLYGGAIFDSWSRAVPGASDFVTYDVLQPGNRLVETDRVPAENKYSVDSDIDHARTDEFNVSFEQQVFGRMKATATYIRRETKNFIKSFLVDGLWAPTTVTNVQTNQPMTIYRWANRGTQRFNITNVDDVTYFGPGGQTIGTAEAVRDYNGLMLVLTRPYQNRWQAQASYVYSQTEGTVPSSGATFSQFDTPNTILINADGRAAIDPTHEFKLFLGYQVPRIEVSLNTYYRSVSGTTYTPFQRLTAGTINWTTTNDVFLEPRGSYRNDHINIVDLRLEKVFNAGFNRFGVYADIENLFNVGTVTARQARYPSAAISGNTVLFGGPTSVTAARQTTFGARWSF
jgi:carboxypeptidase family protein